MNKEEILKKYIDLIDKGYCSDCNELNCIDNFPHAKITHAIRELQQENQELKLELSGYRQAILKDKEMLGLKEENDKLKKQLEELEKENFNLRENIYINKISFSSEGKNIKELIEMPTYEDLINQQKEFIEYLEDLIKQNETVVEVSKYGLPKNCSKLLIDFYKEILSKYKEIAGVSDDR